MVKRKASSNSEDEAQLSDASSETNQKSKAPVKNATSKKTKQEPPSDLVSDTLKSAEGKVSNSSIALKKKGGQKYIDLGKKKRATIHSFKNIPLLDIREYYDTGSEEKPGKKGISLTFEQWQVLKANVNVIDKSFSDLSKDTE